MSEPAAQPHPESASYTPAYRTYVLVVLLLTYVVNVMDRGVLALLLEGIRKEFELTDGQLGFLASLPFAIFYSTLGIPIAALADRTVRRNVLAASCALWSDRNRRVRHGLQLHLAHRRSRVHRHRRSRRHAAITFTDFGLLLARVARRALSIYALGVPIGTMLGNLLGGWGNPLFRLAADVRAHRSAGRVGRATRLAHGARAAARLVRDSTRRLRTQKAPPLTRCREVPRELLVLSPHVPRRRTCTPVVWYAGVSSTACSSSARTECHRATAGIVARAASLRSAPPARC